jgi:hypothetical protein
MIYVQNYRIIDAAVRALAAKKRDSCGSTFLFTAS